MSPIKIYTDGGADPNPGRGGWGAVLIDSGSGTRRELSGGADDTTNNRMEMTAAIEALEAIEPDSEVELFTDSSYLKQGITQWIRGWRAAGWKRRDGQAVKNVDLWQELDRIAARHRISWRWVKGHAGIVENERADVLATEEIQRRKGTPAAIGVTPAVTGPAVFLKTTSWPGGGLWEAILRTAGGEEARLTGRENDASANRLELLAACEILERLAPGSRCRIHGASEYLRRGSEMWLAGWKQRGWSTAGGDAVKNADLWQQIDSLLEGREVVWIDTDRRESPELAELTRSLKDRRRLA